MTFFIQDTQYAVIDGRRLYEFDHEFANEFSNEFRNECFNQIDNEFACRAALPGLTAGRPW